MRSILFGLALLAACAASSSAQAFNGCGGYGLGAGFLYNSLDYRVPYFAAHPPVYYSYPVPRPYGYSPFAYGPDVRTPEILAESQPLEINNPYVPSSIKSSASTPADQTVETKPARKAVEPLMVTNPYVFSDSVIVQVSN